MYQVINNHSIYYQKVGTGSKDLILLHGWGQDVSTWWGIVEKLKNDFTLYLIDLPGFGRSDLPKTPFKIKDYAEVVEEFIRKIRIDEPTIVGHSLGGRVAIKLPSHMSSGKVINKLVLVSSAGIKPKQDLIKPLIYPIAKLSKLVPNWFNLKEKLRIAFYRSLESDYLSAGPLRETLKNILDEDLTEDLEKIETETLLIWGEKDPTKEASLKNGKRMYQLIKNCRLEIIDNVGHFPHLESPEMFIYWVKEFCLE